LAAAHPTGEGNINAQDPLATCAGDLNHAAIL